jgi:hypothetical protein
MNPSLTTLESASEPEAELLRRVGLLRPSLTPAESKVADVVLAAPACGAP